MGRVKIEMPDVFLDTISIPIRIGDINYGNHLGNDSLVSLIHESRVQWLSKDSYSELDIEGSSIIMSELVVNYLNESFYGDILQVRLYLGEISTVGFEIFYQVFAKRQDREIEIARVKTGLVFYNYSLKKIASIPSVFKVKLLEKDRH
jgi:acyl-CoA thioesterase FadM